MKQLGYLFRNLILTKHDLYIRDMNYETTYILLKPHSYETMIFTLEI